MAGIFCTGEIDCLTELSDSSVTEMPINDIDSGRLTFVEETACSL